MVLIKQCPDLFELIEDEQKQDSRNKVTYPQFIKNLKKKYKISFKNFGASSYTDTKKILVREMYNEHVQTYSLVPIIFDEISKRNKTTTFILQVDNDFKFYRQFVAVPNAKELYDKICIPTPQTDLTQYRSPSCVNFFTHNVVKVCGRYFDHN